MIIVDVDYGSFTARQMILYEELYVKGFGMDQAIAAIGRLTAGQVNYYLQVVGSMTFVQLEAEFAALWESDAVTQIELDFNAGQDGLIQSTAAVVAENKRRRSSDV